MRALHVRPDRAARAKGCRSLGVKPELEMYHSGQYWVGREVIDASVVEPPYLFQFVMGYQTAAFPTPANLVRLR